MSRFPVSGTATTDIPIGTGAATSTNIYSITSGKVFWLRGVTFTPVASIMSSLELYDATVGGTATTGILRVQVRVQVGNATSIDLPVQVLNLNPPGIKFSNNFVLARTTATVSVILGQGGVAVWGYEE